LFGIFFFINLQKIQLNSKGKAIETNQKQFNNNVYSIENNEIEGADIVKIEFDDDEIQEKELEIDFKKKFKDKYLQIFEIDLIVFLNCMNKYLIESRGAIRTIVTDVFRYDIGTGNQNSSIDMAQFFATELNNYDEFMYFSNFHTASEKNELARTEKDFKKRRNIILTSIAIITVVLTSIQIFLYYFLQAGFFISLYILVPAYILYLVVCIFNLGFFHTKRRQKILERHFSPSQIQEISQFNIYFWRKS